MQVASAATVCTRSRCVAMQMMLKCADIGHLAADCKTHKRWAYQLEEEFFRQVGPLTSHP